jgi:endo-1,4-beta-mannosidase
LEAAKDAGLKVIRTWAFHDQNKTYVSGGLPQYNTGAENTVMQVFNSDGSVKIDLSKLDVVIEAAEATDMKLILALTNNWADYGGMDVYTVNLGGRYHDDVSTTIFNLGKMSNASDLVLPSTCYQEGLQELHQDCCRQIQGLFCSSRLGNCQRTPLRRRRYP